MLDGSIEYGRYVKKSYLRFSLFWEKRKTPEAQIKPFIKSIDQITWIQRLELSW